MVKAVADLTVSEEIPLKTLEGGWIKLRKLTYGQMMHRQDIAAKMAITSDQRSKNVEMAIDMAQAVVTQFEFANCIIDHNLEDENGVKLNLSATADINRLDPQVGAEISDLIDGLNQLPEDMQSGK
jgi:hypothetical protein